MRRNSTTPADTIPPGWRLVPFLFYQFVWKTYSPHMERTNDNIVDLECQTLFLLRLALFIRSIPLY